MEVEQSKTAKIMNSSTASQEQKVVNGFHKGGAKSEEGNPWVDGKNGTQGARKKQKKQDVPSSNPYVNLAESVRPELTQPAASANPQQGSVGGEATGGTEQKPGASAPVKKKQEGCYAALSTDMQDELAKLKLNKQMNGLQSQQMEQGGDADAGACAPPEQAANGRMAEGPTPAQLQQTVVKMIEQQQGPLGVRVPPGQRNVRHPPGQVGQQFSEGEARQKKSKKSRKGGRSKGCYVELAEMIAPELAKVSASFTNAQSPRPEGSLCESSSSQDEQPCPGEDVQGNSLLAEDSEAQSNPQGNSRENVNKSKNAYVELAEMMQPELAEVNMTFNRQQPPAEPYVFVGHDGETQSVYSPHESLSHRDDVSWAFTLVSTSWDVQYQQGLSYQ